MKKIMKRSVALGALMAFVITGSAMAASTIGIDASKADAENHNGVIENVNIGIVAGDKNGVQSITGIFDGAATDEKNVVINVAETDKSSNVFGIWSKGNSKVFVGNESTGKVFVTAKNYGKQSAGVFSQNNNNSIAINGNIIEIDIVADGETVGYNQANSYGVSSSSESKIYLGTKDLTDSISLKVDSENENATGIKSSGDNSEIKFEAKDINIAVKGTKKALAFHGSDVSSAKIDIIAENKLEFSAGSSGNAWGAYVGNGQKLSLSAKDIYGFVKSIDGTTVNNSTLLESNRDSIIDVIADKITLSAYDGVDDTTAIKAIEGGRINIGNSNSDIVITAEGNGITRGLYAGLGDASLVDVHGKNVSITVNSEDELAYGIYTANATLDIEDADCAKVKINADKIVIDAETAIVALSKGKVDVNGSLFTYGKNVIEARGDAEININKGQENYYTRLNGDIAFAYDESGGTGVDSKVMVNLTGKGSYWNGNAKVSWSAGSKEEVENQLNVTGLTVSLSKGAQWNPEKIINLGVDEYGNVLEKEGVKYHALNNLKLDGGIVNLEKAEDQTVEIENIYGKGEIVVASEKNSLEVTKENKSELTVGATTEYSKELAKGEVADGLQKLANQVVDNTTAGAGKSAADTVTMTETGVLGATSAKIDKDGNVIVASIDEKVNSSNAGIAQMGSVALMTWRQENNDMNKRLGELRNSNGEHGIWTRMTRGESDFEGIKNQYNSYQIGYDEKLSTDKSWTVGAALTYTDGESSFAEGTGENTHKGFAIYGSKLNEDGSFIDLIAKYARLEHEFDAIGGAGNGEYDTNGYSVSAEYGKRFEQGNGFWVEPQVELTYGKVGSASYKTSEGVKVQQDGVDSLVGRVGFSLGKDIKQGNVYVRASYLYDFDGETSMSFSDDKHTRTIEQDLGGWFEVGVGTNYNLSDATYLYFDVEKTYGGDVATPWQWNAGVRYSF